MRLRRPLTGIRRVLDATHPFCGGLYKFAVAAARLVSLIEGGGVGIERRESLKK